MARIDHTNCSHPRTPAGRAGCRKAGTWQEAAGIAHLVTPTADDKPRKTTGRSRGVTVPDTGRSARTRALKANHDLADVPAAFGHVIRWAWEASLSVRTASPYNDTERRIEIESEPGWLTLVWKAATPDGINASFWRPRGSSVTSKLMSVNVGLDRLKGE